MIALKQSEHRPLINSLHSNYITFAGPYLSGHRHNNSNIDMGSLFTSQQP